MYKVGEITFDFGPNQSFMNIFKLILPMKGTINESYGMHLKSPISFYSTPEQDIKMLKTIREEIKNRPFYHGLFHNCILWTIGAINYGME